MVGPGVRHHHGHMLGHAVPFAQLAVGLGRAHRVAEGFEDRQGDDGGEGRGVQRRLFVGKRWWVGEMGDVSERERERERERGREGEGGEMGGG